MARVCTNKARTFLIGNHFTYRQPLYEINGAVYNYRKLTYFFSFLENYIFFFYDPEAHKDLNFIDSV